DLLLDQGRLDEAGGHFRRVLQQQPANGRAALGLARLAYERGDLPESITHLDRSVTDVHARKASRILLAQIYERLGNQAGAEQQLRQAAELPNDSAWPDPFQDRVVQLRVGKQASLGLAERRIQGG